MAVEDGLSNALGNLGGRPKSWMQTANSSSATARSNIAPSELTVNPLPFSIRKRGRPRKHFPPADTARPTIEPQADTQPSSNSTSTSPQLANAVARQNNSAHTASVVTIFPSPTPSEEPPQSASVPAPADDATNLDFLQIPADQAQDTSIETMLIEAARREGIGTKRMSMSAGGEAQKRIRQEQPPVQAGATHEPQSAFAQPTYPEFPRRPSIPQGHIGSPQLLQRQSRSPSLGAHNDHMPSPQLQQHVPTPTTSVMSPQMVFGTAGAASLGPDMTLYSTPAQSPGLFDQAPFSMTQFVDLQPTWYTRQECLHAMDVFQSSFAVPPNNQRDARRIMVLRNAADQQDWQYLLMHQFYCLFDYNRNSLPPDLLALPGLQQALRLMQDVLDTNKKLSPTVIHFFSDYPCSMDQMRLNWPAGYEEQINRFRSFVAHAHHYESVKLTCERRRFPPIAWELASYLGLQSGTFQRLLFTATLRSIWREIPSNPQQSHYENRAITILQQTQVSYNQRTVGQPGRRASDQNQIQVLQADQNELQVWGHQLKHLVGEYETAMSRQGYPVTNSVVGNLPHLQQQQAHQTNPQPQPIVSTAQQGGRGRPRKNLNSPSTTVSGPVRMPTHQREEQMPQQVQQNRQQFQPPPHAQGQQHQPDNRGQQSRQRPPARLLPPAGWVQPQQRIPNPARFGLHQAHLQSPVLHAKSLQSPLYHFMQGFIKPPARLTTANEAVEKWSFTFDADMAQCIPALIPHTRTGADRRAVDTQSKTIRIRCIKWPGTEPPTEHAWATADTSWIPYSYFSFNVTSLQQRKKVHNGKDLPIDVTGLVKEGPNTLEMTVMSQSSDMSYQNYLVAIEYLGVISQASIRRDCLEQYRIPAQQVLADIQRKLSGNSEDDEIAVVESNLSITLFDPFTASKICDTPVRSRACLHNDCFDLDTFLETRRRKGDVSTPDQWRCPICNVDARPQHLIVDGFLEEVKKVLDAQGRSNTRAIVVHQDGSWKPKVEVRDPNGVSDVTSEPPTPVMANTAAPSRSSIPAHAEIIDLSD